MADDQFQRSYRASEPPVRGPAKSTGNDPLAELARLIGQTDPFGEFGREAARRPAAPPSEERSDWNTQPLGTRYTPQAAPDSRAGVLPQRSTGNGYYTARSAPPEQLDAPQSEHGVQGYGRQTYSGTPPADEDAYPADHEARGYAPGQADYPQDAYEQDVAQQADDEYYEDAPSSRRRLGVMAIAGVLALAVVGTAGAFGYRTLFGSSGSPQPPPVIKADAGPNKIVPATAGKDSQANKLITERVNERGQSERLVSREEQPIDKPTAVVLSQPQQQLPMGSGVIGTEPKKVRTIAIHPDQVADASAPGTSPLAAAPRTAPAPAPAARASAPPARAATGATADAEDDAAPAPAARSAVRQAAPASGNAPLSLNPDASAAARASAAPARTAAVAPPVQPAPAASSGTAGPGSYVQVSSQRSEAEAQSAFRSLQAKYPTQLGGRQLQILKADLGAKGTYYRAAVGPFGNANEAAELCSSLKSAGGQCLIQRN